MNPFLEAVGGYIGLGVLVLSVSYAWTQIRSGATKAKDELVSTYKEQLALEKEKTKQLEAKNMTLEISHQKQINELSKQIGILEGTLKSQQEKMKEYLEILQGRSPEQIKFMEYLTKAASQSESFMSGSAVYMKDTTEVLGEIKIFMQKLNAKAAETAQWHESIDKATELGEGNPLRKK